MARRKKKNGSKKADPAAIPDALRIHLPELRLDSVGDYLAWCREHGLHPSIGKSLLQMRKEQAIVERRNVDDVLRRSRRARRPAEALGSICAGTLCPEDIGAHHLLAPALRIAAIPQGRPYREGLPELLSVVGARTSLLLETCPIGKKTFPYLEALIALNERRDAWLRPVTAFRPRSRNRRRQFTELVRHLVAEYAIPVVMEQAWLRTDRGSRRLRDWYVHAARGGSLRHVGAPIPLTRRMAHLLQFAPDTYTIESAIRWTQVRALGGGSELAQAIARTHVGSTLLHDSFWQAVFRYLIGQERFDLRWTESLLEFIRHQKFDALEVVQADATVNRYPPERPHFTIKGRKFAGLLDAVANWQRHVTAMHVGAAEWEPAAINPYRFETVSEKSGRRLTWTIRQLLSKQALAEEGRELGHCVSAYTSFCKRGRCSIWSLEASHGGGMVRLQTIQVTRNRRVVQSRGRFNEGASPNIRAIVERWAEREGLAVNRRL